MGEEGDLPWARRCLDAIHKIRQQKQRPSLERIVHAVRQQHSSSEAVVAEHLERLVTKGLILKVFNKGLSTYKDPGCGGRRVNVGPDADLTKVVLKGVRELAEKTPDGCTPKALESYLQTSLVLCLEKGADLASLVRAGLRRGVARGAIQVTKNLYRPAPGTFEPNSTPGKRGRPSRAAIEGLSPKKEGLPICLECLGTAQKNKDGVEEELKFCASCGSGVHPTCIPDNHGDTFKLLLSRGNLWKCDECYQCPNCSATDQVAGVVCTKCDRGFHLGCLDPAVDRKGKDAWTCQSCTEGKPPPTPSTPPSSGSPLRKKQHSSLRVAHLKSLRKAARANLVRRRGKVKEGNESSSEDVSSLNSLMNCELPPGVTEKDLETFKMAREKASEMTKEQQTLPDGMASPKDKGLPPRCPAAIEFGDYLIKTWYSSPFPQEYARLGKLFLCEFCLKYAKSKFVLNRHLEKCSWRHPPGTEIYRHQDISVFEVDGNVAKFYCQNLCLLAKLFLDHKTLYYDVEPFLFYVLAISDEKGFHLVGYFSKEKHCVQKYNVSCIMTLPHYQRKGYGRFLIDFSYLLSKAEGMAGTPEKPLSDLGRVSYHAYWRSIILEYLDSHRNADITLTEISKETGLHVEDIATSLEEMKLVREVGGAAALVVDWAAVDTHAARVKASSTRITLVPEALRWTPLVTQHANPYQPPTEEAEEASEDESSEEEKEPEEPKVKVEETPKGRGKGNKRQTSARAVSPTPPSRGAKRQKAKEASNHKTPVEKPSEKKTPLETPRGRKKVQPEKEQPAPTPEVAPRKRGRASAPAAPVEPEPEPLPPKRRRTEIVRPGRLSSRKAAEPASRDSSDEDDSPPLITRTGRVSSLKIKRLLDSKPHKKDSEKPVRVSKQSIAAKLRWVERKKRQLLIQSGQADAEAAAATPSPPKSEGKRKPGRPPKVKQEMPEPVQPKAKVTPKVEQKAKPSQPVAKTESAVEEKKKESVPLARKLALKKRPKKAALQLKRFGQKKKRGWMKGRPRGSRKVTAAPSADAAPEKPAASPKKAKTPVAKPTPKKEEEDIEEKVEESAGDDLDKPEPDDTVDDQGKDEDSVDDSRMDVEDDNMLKVEEVKKVPKEPEMVDIAATADDETVDGEDMEKKEANDEEKMGLENKDEEEKEKEDEDKSAEDGDDEDEDKEEKKETREPVKMERRVLSDDSDDSRPPRSDHSRSPSPRHSSDDDLDLDKKSSPMSSQPDIPDTVMEPIVPAEEEKPVLEPVTLNLPEPLIQELVKPVLKPEPPIILPEVEEAPRVVKEERKPKEEKVEERPPEEREPRREEPALVDNDQSRATVDLTQDDDSPPEPPSRPQEHSRERSCEMPRKIEAVKELVDEKIRDELLSRSSKKISMERSCEIPRKVEPVKDLVDEKIRDELSRSSSSVMQERVPSHYTQADILAQQKKVAAASERSANERAAAERVVSERAAMQAAAERAMAAAASAASASVLFKQAQERNPQVSCYTDCAQQAAAAAHHQHHMASQHMVHYHQQQAAAVAMQQAAVAAAASKSSSGSSSRSKSSSSSTQRHQVGSPQPGYQAQTPSGYSAYMLHRVPPAASPASQPPPRPVPCSNFYLQQSGQQPGSLAKLQQLTNGLETLSPHQLAGSTPPPPGSHGTPPPPGSYHKFYQGTSPSAAATAATAAAGRHAQQLLPQYGPPAFNGYRAAPQQPTATPSYLAAAAANPNFINAQQMQMMNVQPQYSQDQSSAAAAAANPMYTYGYLNGTLMQPLNSTMRR